MVLTVCGGAAKFVGGSGIDGGCSQWNGFLCLVSQKSLDSA